jgi:hypothetical protein
LMDTHIVLWYNVTIWRYIDNQIEHGACFLHMLKDSLMSESVSCRFRFSTSHAKKFVNSVIRCFSPIYSLHYNNYLILSFFEHESDFLILTWPLFQRTSLEFFTYKDPILYDSRALFCLFNFLAMCHFSSLSIIEIWSILVYKLHELTFGLHCMPNLEKWHVSCMSEVWHYWLEGKHSASSLH